MSVFSIKKVVLATIALGVVGSVFANPQAIAITDKLMVSGNKTSLTLFPKAMLSRLVSCTLDGSTQDLCKTMHSNGAKGVVIPYGWTLTVEVYPVALPGQKPIPGMFNWILAYTQGPCYIQSSWISNNPEGLETPPDIKTTVNDSSYFEGGSAICH